MKRGGGIGIRYIFTILSLTPALVATVLLIVVLGWSGRSTVSDMTRRLGLEVAARIGAHVDSFVSSVAFVNEMNARLLAAGELDVSDPDALQAVFAAQIRLLPGANSVYFGNARGGLVGAGIDPGTPYVTRTDGFEAGTFNKYEVDETGRIVATTASVPGFDARTRSWYQAALESDRVVWNDAYVLITGQDMAIAASRAAVDPTGSVVGVFSVDAFVSHLSSYLAALTYGTSGVGFIVDDQGLFVASSVAEPLFTSDGSAVRRISPEESSAPVARLAAAQLEPDAAADQTFPNATRFRSGGAWHTMVVDRLDLNGPADWRSVVVFPERDFLADLDRGYRIAFVVLAFVLAAVFGIVIRVSWHVTDPLYRLANMLDSFAGGVRPTVSGSTSVREVRLLIASFDSMSNQLDDTMSALNREVVDRRRSEERLSVALREREVLMRELNHRTKNNMNIISAMVQLQAGTVSDPQAVQALRDLEGRIRSMALVHEKLHRGDGLATVSLPEYFQDLVELLGSGVGLESRRITVDLDADAAEVSIDVAVPCGLVVNELVTNAVKHGFPDGRPGTITIALRRPAPGGLTLTVGDDGVGLPPGFDPRRQDSLGLRFLYAIVEGQLGGSVRFESNGGVRCVCEFPAGWEPADAQS